ncbi:redoxin domain-containing protein [Chloroflexota bacterium]
MVRIGHEVPDFELDAFHAGDIRKVKLSENKDKWLILMFYPADFTVVCPTELEEAADNYTELKRAGAEVMSVSTDRVAVHKAWYNQSPAVSKVKFPMLSDPSGILCREFGIYVEEEGHALRGSFVIDPDRILRAYEVHDNRIGRNIKELLRKFQAAKYVLEHPGTACPASWEVGREALIMDIDLAPQL